MWYRHDTDHGDAWERERVHGDRRLLSDPSSEDVSVHVSVEGTLGARTVSMSPVGTS